MNKQMLALLYRSFDEPLTQEQLKELDDALSSSSELKQEKERIAKMRVLLSESAQKSFKPFFAEKVVQRVNKLAKSGQEIFFESLFKLFRPVAIAAAVVIITIVSYNLFKSGELSINSALGQPELTFEDVIDPAFVLTMEITQ